MNMFGKQAKAIDDKKPPMIGGSAAMMLKGMGINAEQVEGVALQLIDAVQSVDKRLAAIEAQNTEILAWLREDKAPDGGAK